MLNIEWFMVMGDNKMAAAREDRAANNNEMAGRAIDKTAADATKELTGEWLAMWAVPPSHSQLGTGNVGATPPNRSPTWDKKKMKKKVVKGREKCCKENL